jgi:hypothetical protein
MKTIQILLAVLLVSISSYLHAQVSVSDTGNPPDPSAMLDVQSTDKGMLVPRIDFDNRPVPAAPGLLIYVTANGPLGNDALYFFDGTDWRKIISQSETEVAIGSEMEGGIVFYYDQNEGTGLVSSQVDETWGPWGCFGTLMGPNAQYTFMFSGGTNTFTIVDNCTETGIAARTCDDLILNGYDDWFLPSVDELLEMYSLKETIGGFVNTLYWSSSEAAPAAVPEEAAWVVNFSDGSYGWTSKANVIGVRCVRQFFN